MSQKTMTTTDTVLFGISAMLFIDQLTANASFGYAAVPTFILLLGIYIIPYSLVVSELATTYPDEGGVYAWVSRAFGAKTAANVSWWYWINQMLYLPTAFLLFSGVYAQLFFPDMSTGAQILMAIALTVITTWTCTLDKSFAKWFPNIGAVIKVVVIAVISIGGIYAGINGAPATEMTREAFVPAWGAGAAFFAIMVFNSTGWDTIGAMAPYMKNPARSIPIAVMISAAIVVGMYCLSVIGLLFAIPLPELGLVAGFVDSLNVIFDGYAIKNAVVLLLGLAMMFTFFTNMVTWCLAANEAAMASGREGELPKVFGIQTKTGTPLGAPLLGCAVAVVEMLVYWMIAGDAEDIFWMSLAFSTILFFLPPMAMFLAAGKLRDIDPDTPRPFRIPLSAGGVKAMSILPVIIMSIAIYLLVVPPGDAVDWAYVGAMVIGCILVIGGGAIMVNRTVAKAEAQSEGALTPGE